MANRKMENRHVTIGSVHKTPHKNSPRFPITLLESYMGDGKYGWDKAVSFHIKTEKIDTYVNLTSEGTIELVKGLLMNLCEVRGGPISMTANEELQKILAVVQGAIQRGEEEARQMVVAMTEHTGYLREQAQKQSEAPSE